MDPWRLGKLGMMLHMVTASAVFCAACSDLVNAAAPTSRSRSSSYSAFLFPGSSMLAHKPLNKNASLRSSAGTYQSKTDVLREMHDMQAALHPNNIHGTVAIAVEECAKVTRRGLGAWFLTAMSTASLSVAEKAYADTKDGEDGAANQEGTGKGKTEPYDKVRKASSGKFVVKDDFCPEPKPGQVILMNCQKAKIKRAKRAQQVREASTSPKDQTGP